MTTFKAPVNAPAPQIYFSAKLFFRFLFAVPIIGHVGDGNFHCLIMIDPSDQQEMAAAIDLSNKIARYKAMAGWLGPGLH